MKKALRKKWLRVSALVISTRLAVGAVFISGIKIHESFILAKAPAS